MKEVVTKAVQRLMQRLGLRPRRGRARFHDAMPPGLARDLAIKANERYEILFNRYLRGELPRWANKEFEQWLFELDNSLQKLESDFSTGRNGHPSQRERCLEQIPKLLAQGLTDEQAAAECGVTPRSYQRHKQEFRRRLHIHVHHGSGGKEDA